MRYSLIVGALSLVCVCACSMPARADSIVEDTPRTSEELFHNEVTGHAGTAPADDERP
jgi:hypothetical protein